METLDVLALEVPFIEEDVFGALLGCSGDKASRPDGFSIAFCQFPWDFVKDDVIRFFGEFYEHCNFVKSPNATFLVLIQKKSGG